LLNEWMAEVVRCFPERFSFYVVTPLPFVSAALKEVRYAVDELGAVGIGLMSNFEGLYLGNPRLKDFFVGVDGMELAPGKKIMFVHPTVPVKRLANGSLEDANPSKY